MFSDVLEDESTYKLWSMSRPEEDLGALLFTTSTAMMENPENFVRASTSRSAAALREAIFKVFAVSVKKFGLYLRATTAIVHMLCNYEHLAAHLPELCRVCAVVSGSSGASGNDDEQHASSSSSSSSSGASIGGGSSNNNNHSSGVSSSSVRVVRDVLREIGRMNVKLVAVDTKGARNVSTFLADLAAKVRPGHKTNTKPKKEKTNEPRHTLAHISFCCLVLIDWPAQLSGHERF